ncbi:MAG: hypothetical protein ACLFR2_13185 [Candidatus Kapaibacterium sp.]
MGSFVAGMLSGGPVPGAGDDVARGVRGILIGQKANSFFKGTHYSKKVYKQMEMNDFHGFPENARAFEKDGIRDIIKGGDGVYRERLRIPGTYKNKKDILNGLRNPMEP